jgi:hypothetical protein
MDHSLSSKSSTMSRFAAYFVRISCLLVALSLVTNSVFADPRFNAQRASGEPQWEGKVFLQGEAKAIKDATPILERPYRPLHLYGNMQRRHHYRDTVIPSRTDRHDRREAFTSAR